MTQNEQREVIGGDLRAAFYTPPLDHGSDEGYDVDYVLRALRRQLQSLSEQLVRLVSLSDGADLNDLSGIYHDLWGATEQLRVSGDQAESSLRSRELRNRRQARRYLAHHS